MRVDGLKAWCGVICMVRRCVIAVLILLFGVVPGFASGLILHEVVPEALGVGQAYTALARGPLAPLWNPAGIGNLISLSPSVQILLFDTLIPHLFMSCSPI